MLSIEQEMEEGSVLDIPTEVAINLQEIIECATQIVGISTDFLKEMFLSDVEQEDEQLTIFTFATDDSFDKVKVYSYHKTGGMRIVFDEDTDNECQHMTSMKEYIPFI